MSALRKLDPRRSLAVRLAIIIVVLTLLLAFGISRILGEIALREAETDVGELYAEATEHIRDRIVSDITMRQQTMRVLASAVPSELTPEGVQTARELLNRVQDTSPEFAWIALADANGNVVATTHGASSVSEGQSVAQAAWFTEAKRDSFGYVGATTPSTDAQRGIDVSAPVRDANGQLVGVVGAQLSWDWLRATQDFAVRPLRDRLKTDVLIVGRDGEVLIGPPDLVGSTLDIPKDFLPRRGPAHATLTWPGGLQFLVGFSQMPDRGPVSRLGWTVLARAPAEQAFSDAITLQARVFLTSLGLGLLFATLGVFIVRRMTDPLNRIADAADKVRLEQAKDIPVFSGDDEVGRLSKSLSGLVVSLENRNEELNTLNATLEERVDERTREVQRLSDENKQAAVTRERLRLARDLHDTLAHTMAGLLTEIRVLRKLASSDAGNRETMVKELDFAEGVASSGLREARAAITDLRTTPVQEYGLAEALRRRVRQFTERNGIEATFECDDDAARGVPLDKADTVYRIGEEALRNIEHHAHASRAEVSLRRGAQPATMQLIVHDNGVGFNPSAPLNGHFGLRGMAELAELAGANLHVASQPNAGVTVTLTLGKDEGKKVQG